MDEELKRVEEKQKLTNLQIEKRLVMLENTLDDIKSSFESISSGVTERDIDNLSKKLADIKKEETEQNQQLKQFTENFDVSKLMEDFGSLQDSFTQLRLRFEEKVSEVESLQEQLVGLERRGKLPQCEDGFEDLKYKVDVLLQKINSLENKVNELQKVDFSRKVSQPIIIE